MKYLAVLGNKEIFVEAENGSEAQKIATRKFRTRKTVYVCVVDIEKGFVGGVQLALFNP